MKNKTGTMIRTLCVDDAPAATNGAAIKQAATSLSQCLASLEDVLTEPMKTEFGKIKSDVQVVLASLTPADETPAANDELVKQLVSLVKGSQIVIVGLADSAKNAKQIALASLTDETNKAIAAKVTAGEFIPKADHETAIKTAETNARASVEAQNNLRAARITTLAGIGIANPTSSMLMLDAKDEAFNAKCNEAKTRIEALQPYKVAGDKMITLAWDRDQDSFQDTLGLLKDNASSAPVKLQVNASAEAAKEGKPIYLHPGMNPFSRGTVASPAPAAEVKTKMGVL